MIIVDGVIVNVSLELVAPTIILDDYSETVSVEARKPPREIDEVSAIRLSALEYKNAEMPVTVRTLSGFTKFEIDPSK